MPALITNTNNPIRKIIEQLNIVPHKDFEMIPLSIGDPSVFGNFDPPKEAIEAVTSCLNAGNSNGYSPAIGTGEARRAVAKYMSQFFKYEPEIADIALANGASGALEFAISVIAERGDNILVARPGFPLYNVLAQGQGIDCKYYDLESDNNWEVDTDSLEDAIDENTAAVIFINPSNPTGAVFKRNHMQKLVDICEKYKVTIIADEIYAGMTYHGVEYVSFVELAKTIPVIHVGGLAKRFLVPGWRMGWTITHDPKNIFKNSLTIGIAKMSTRLVGPNKLIQSAMPKILGGTPESWHIEQNAKLGEAADMFYKGLKNALGLTPIMPDGAMYMMVKIDFSLYEDIKDDLTFVQQLVAERSVFCLPGSCFGSPKCIRVVITVPQSKIPEACERIADFCDSHKKL